MRAAAPKPQRDLTAEARSLGPWFHNLHLPGGVQTAPDHFLGDFPAFKWAQVEHCLPADLSGQTVLDIGVNAGFYAIKLAQRGARVTGVDADDRYLSQARWAAQVLNLHSQIELKHMQVYDLARLDQTFDLVLFMGVFYHLRYPLLGLDIASRLVRGRMLFQTLTMPGETCLNDTQDRAINDRHDLLDHGWPKMAFIEHAFSGDPTNWWIANHAGVEAMLRSSGMRIVSRPAHEFYLCEPDPDRPSPCATWNKPEFLAATGLSTARASST